MTNVTASELDQLSDPSRDPVLTDSEPLSSIGQPVPKLPVADVLRAQQHFIDEEEEA